MSRLRGISLSLLSLGACQGGTGDSEDIDYPCHCSLDADVNRPDADRGSDVSPHYVPLDGAPFVHSDSTATSLTRVYDAYDCNPAIDESGSEVWYDLTTDHPIPLEFTLTPEQGVAVDMYLLTFGKEGSSETCLASGDASLEATLPIGRNILIVDTPRIEGVERPGAYELSIVDGL